MLIDVNVLLFAVDTRARMHERAIAWLEAQMRGSRLVGIPWESIGGFLRISTNPRASEHPLRPERAWSIIEEWLAAPNVWVPAPTDRHAEVLGALIRKYDLSGNMISDAHLAAIAIEHGLEICSADTDFARFTEVRWRNPLAD